MDIHESIKREVPQTDPDEVGNQGPDDEGGGSRAIGPDVIQSSPVGRGNEKQSLATEADSNLDSEVANLLQNAVEELGRAIPKLRHSAQEREAAIRVYLARAYKLSMAGWRDTKMHEALVRQIKIKRRNDTPHHKQTLRIIQVASKSPYVKGNEHEWSVVLVAMQEAGVDETEDAVIRFLTENEVIDGETVRGFERARKIWENSEKKIKRNRKKQSDKDKQRAVETVASKVRSQPLGSIGLADGRSISKTTWISLNEGGKVLLDLNLDENDLQKILLKYENNAKKKSEPPQ